MADAKERKEAFDRGDFNKPRVFPLFLKSGETAPITFIGNIGEEETQEPYGNFIHAIPPASGKGLWDIKLCQGSNCSMCQMKNKRKFRSFFTVVDHRSREWDGNTYANEVRYWEAPSSSADRFLNKLYKFMSKNGLQDAADIVVEISKYGEGTDTTVDFEFDIRNKDSFVVPEDARPLDFRAAFGGTSKGNSPLYD
jgi:hypothetical protein